jgi:hypothetical protein
MSADNAFQLFSPSVQVVETSYENSQITFFRYFGARIFYNVQVVKTCWIRTPLFPIRGLNLTIPNPSNFSIYDDSKYLPWELKPFAVRVEAEPALAYTINTNSAGNVTSIDVETLKSSEVKPYSFIRLTYNDALDFDFIDITQPIEVNLGNGTILVTMSLIVKNVDSRRLYSDDFALFGIQNYGNLTSFTFRENGTIKPSQWNLVREQWLWTSFYVNPHSSVDFTISTIFSEAPH